MTQMLLDTFPMGRHIVLDTETTGFTPKGGHRIVELGAVEIIDGVITGNTFHSYFDPKRDVPAVASDVHGLTNAFLKGKPRFRDVLPELSEFLGDPQTPVWAHSAPFDCRFVEAEYAWAKAPFEHGFECSLKLAKKLDLGTQNAKLETLAPLVGYQWSGRGAHSALEDSKALAKVLIELIWPRACETPGKVKKAAKTKSAAPQAAPAQVSIDLPADFTPLTAAEDARIRRYDDLETGGRLFARGVRWTADEARALVDRFLKEKACFDSLVAAHGRTPAALMLKLEGLGVVAENHPYARRS